MWLPLMQSEDPEEEEGSFGGLRPCRASGSRLIWATSSLKALLWVSCGEGRKSLPGREGRKV